MPLFGRRSVKVREVVLSRLDPGEHVLVEGPVKDLSMGGADAYLVVTTARLIWTFTKRPDLVLDMNFELVHDVVMNEGAIKVTSRDPGYASVLNDPGNPEGETDAAFFISGPIAFR